jgi:hypothetical protein
MGRKDGRLDDVTDSSHGMHAIIVQGHIVPWKRRVRRSHHANVSHLEQCATTALEGGLLCAATFTGP